MKKNIITLILGLFCTLLFAQKVIENPSFEFTKSGILNITKIELNKNETKIHILNKFLPSWWTMFKKDVFIETGINKKYIIAIEGAEFGEKIFMPDSGEKLVVLVFPPLNDTVASLNYNNQIFGISLKKDGKSNNKKDEIPKDVSKWITSELDKVTIKPLKSYDSPAFFNRSPAKLIGYIKGYDVRAGFETGIMYMGNDITREDYPIVVQIYPDGRFEAELPLTNPVYTYIRFDKIIIEPYLEPGQTLAMVLDWEEFLYADRYRNKRHKFKNIAFKGPLAKINEDLLNFDYNPFNYKAFKNKIKKQSPDAFKEKEVFSYQENVEILSTYLENNSVSKKAEILLKNKIHLEHATHLFDFASQRKYQAKKDSLNEVLKIPVTDDYYDFLQNINLNDQSLLVLDRFGTFINRFAYSEPILVYPKSNTNILKPKKTILEYFEEAKIVVSENDKILMEVNKNKRYKSYEAYQESLKLFSETYRKGLQLYQELYINPLQKKKSQEISMEKWRLRDSVVKNTFKLEKNLIYDIVKIGALNYDIKGSDTKNAHKYWRTLKKDIVNPFLKEEGSRIVNKKFPVIEKQDLDGNISTAANIQPITTKLPEGRATDVFKKIIEPFKGKIVFVDFWATSCGPCIGSIKRMKETRKKYEGNKDFDFVFITDKSGSPEKTYNKFVEEQELNNTSRLSADDYNYLRQLFKFNGIPRYVVIDKNGDVINDHFSMYRFNDLLDGILAQNN